jgi:hypothetical protein
MAARSLVLQMPRQGTRNRTPSIPTELESLRHSPSTIRISGRISLRGNAVVRWEYRPGSALYFVWQQSRSDFLPFEGDFRLRRETTAIFGRPSNVFLVKATYWFAR